MTKVQVLNDFGEKRIELLNRTFFDEEFYKKMLTDYEDIRYRRKQLKGKPDAETSGIIDCEKVFESFYRRFLDL